MLDSVCLHVAMIKFSSMENVPVELDSTTSKVAVNNVLKTAIFLLPDVFVKLQAVCCPQEPLDAHHQTVVLTAVGMLIKKLVFATLVTNGFTEVAK